MFIKDLNFTVIRSKYSERHFLKDFLKKYGNRKWGATEIAIFETLKRIFTYQQTALIDPINFSQEDNCGIYKLRFAIAGENKSLRDSYRLIFFVDNKKELIEMLLIYGKRHCSKKQSETQWIKEQIKNNFSKYRKYCV